MEPSIEPSSRSQILVVDDDGSIRRGICDYLGRHGYDVRAACGGPEMDQEIASGHVDLIVLDVMMPGEDGLAICRRLRPSRIPVLMLSALGETTDRVVGLEMGADDYLPKPFEPRELLARVRALLRRASEKETTGGPALLFAGWRLDLVRRELTDPNGAAVILTGGELALLRAFLDHPRHVLSRNQLMDLARGLDSEIYDRAVDLQVSRLRRKLEQGGGGDLIETVRGEGYRFTSPVRQS